MTNVLRSKNYTERRSRIDSQQIRWENPQKSSLTIENIERSSTRIYLAVARQAKHSAKVSTYVLVRFLEDAIQQFP